MNLKANKYYYIVKINKKEQQEKKEKIGRFYVSQKHVFMTRNMQNGVICDIGIRVKESFPEVKVGDTLIFHHFIEDSEFLLESDETFNYYAVPGMDVPIWEDGVKKAKHPNRAYAFYDGHSIFPHEEYIFLKPEVQEDKIAPLDKFIEENVTQTESGIHVFKNWKESNEDKIAKLDALKKKAERLAHGGVNQDYVIGGIKNIEAEKDQITKTMYDRMFLPYLAAAVHPIVSRWCETQIGEDDILYMDSMGCQTQLDFMGKNYIVAHNKYLAFAQKKLA